MDLIIIYRTFPWLAMGQRGELASIAEYLVEPLMIRSFPSGVRSRVNELESTIWYEFRASTRLSVPFLSPSDGLRRSTANAAWLRRQSKLVLSSSSP